VPPAPVFLEGNLLAVVFRLQTAAPHVGTHSAAGLADFHLTVTAIGASTSGNHFPTDFFGHLISSYCFEGIKPLK